MTSSDTAQAAALSRALRKAGWNPVSSDSPRRYDAGLTVRRGPLGLGATVCLSSPKTRELDGWSKEMAADLTKMGYVFERSEMECDSSGYTVWFRRVRKMMVL